MSDAQFEEFLQREAQAYNPPPADVPRDEMWETIRAARAARSSNAPQLATARPAAGTPRVGGALPVRKDKPTLKYASLIGMAATLLLGIGIGRYALQRDAAVTELASQIATAMNASASEGELPATANAVPSSSSNTAPNETTTAAPASIALNATAVARPTQLTSRSTARLASNGGTATEPNTAMQIVSRDHLSRAEALVSVVAASPADAVMDSLTGRWARDMLTNTRLLLDSPAGDDAVRRRLLEDLETVLVQLLQRTGGAVDERALIDRTLERTQLLSRLRTGAAGI